MNTRMTSIVRTSFFRLTSPTSLQSNLGENDSKNSTQYCSADVRHRLPPFLTIPALNLCQALSLLLMSLRNSSCSLCVTGLSISFSPPFRIKKTALFGRSQIYPQKLTFTARVLPGRNVATKAMFTFAVPCTYLRTLRIVHSTNTNLLVGASEQILPFPLFHQSLL